MLGYTAIVKGAYAKFNPVDLQYMEQKFHTCQLLLSIKLSNPSVFLRDLERQTLGFVLLLLGCHTAQRLFDSRDHLARKLLCSKVSLSIHSD